MKKTIILLTAKHYAGKGFLSKLMQKSCFKRSIPCQIHSARDLISTFITCINAELGHVYPVKEDSANIRLVGQLLTINHDKQNGLPLINSKHVGYIRGSKSPVHIIDSIWHPHLIPIWKNMSDEFNVILLAIEASDEDRFAGFLERNTSTESGQKNPDFFHNRDMQEEQSGVANAPCISECISMADIVFQNNRNNLNLIDDLEKIMDTILSNHALVV